MYNSTDQAYLFKETWSGISKNHYNSATPILSRVTKRYDLTGVKDHVALPFGTAGGVGGLVNGYLPEGGGESGEQIEIIAKDYVGVAVVERKAMKQSMSDKGAFVRFTQRPIQKCVESYDTGANILWHGDGTGRFGTTFSTGYVSGTATDPVIKFDTTFQERWFPKNFQFNFANAGDTGVEDGLFRVESVGKTARTITFKRLSGTYDLTAGTNADGRKVYLQNMFHSAPMGLEGTVMKTSGTIYGITWDESSYSSYQFDANDSPPSVQMINQVYSQQSTRVDEGNLPTFILTSPEVTTILRNIWEPTKTIMLMPKDAGISDNPKFGIPGLEYITPEGKTIAIVSDKHCVKDRMYFLNDDTMYMHHLPDQGWWDEDGQVFMRVSGRPWFAATYGGFYEDVINIQFQAVIFNLGI